VRPPPLRPHELVRLWRWQRRMFVFYGIAIALLGVAVGLMALGDLVWVRRAALGVLMLLAFSPPRFNSASAVPAAGCALARTAGCFCPSSAVAAGLPSTLRPSPATPRRHRPAQAGPACLRAVFSPTSDDGRRGGNADGAGANSTDNDSGGATAPPGRRSGPGHSCVLHRPRSTEARPGPSQGR
jgi:hypothetical protein